MSKINILTKLIGTVIVIMFFTGCGGHGLNYTIKDPVFSSIAYDNKDTTPVTLTIVDQREYIDKAFLVGELRLSTTLVKISGIKLNNMEDPISYFAQNLEREINNRNIPVKCVVGKTATEGLTLLINRYQIASRHVSGYSPFEAFHMFSGTIIKNGQRKMIKAYFYNGKVAVLSMDEIEEPCFNIPISIIIKDVASKINQAVFNLRAPDVKVNRLTDEINSDIGKKDYSNFWKVLELGYTNNPKAMEPLKKYAQTGDDEFFKSCAVSAMGMLGADGQLEFLKQRYREGKFNDKYMAIKAIGDIGTPEALQFMQSLKKEPIYESDGGLKFCVDLYTRNDPSENKKAIEKPALGAKNDGRFIDRGDGTVMDTKTGFMWAAKDNGSDINWVNAKNYCLDYRGGGYTDWRMPTQHELATLYDARKARPAACDKSNTINVATDLIDITCYYLWASENGTRLLRPVAAYLYFIDGKRYWGSQSGSETYRVLPVRYGK